MFYSVIDTGSTNHSTMTILVVISNWLLACPSSSGCLIIGILLLMLRIGISLNRAVEENSAHKNYFVEYGPRRNRLTHSLIFEEFEMVLENWVQLEQEYE